MRFRKVKMKRLTPEITLTPLIDTFATLLVIFMIAAPMVQNNIKLDLPAGKSKETTSVEQDMVVSLDKDNGLFFNGSPVERKELVASVQKMLEGKPEAPVFIQADQAVSYGKVIELVDELKSAQVKYVAMAMRQPTTQHPATK